MASIIRIKRSTVAGNPSTLGVGELAYSALADNGSNGGDRLYIGMGSPETAGNAQSHIVIGGKYFTDMVTNATDANTASTLVRRDASGNFTAGTITAALTGNATSATKWATGRTLSLTGDVGYTSPSFDGTGDVTAVATLATVNANVGVYGSATAIPIVTVNAKGLVTAVSTTSITVGDAALTLAIGTAGATNTSVTIGTGTGFTANDLTAATYDIKIGPALTNLVSFMTTATAGFIRRTAQDTYTIDTNTYLTAGTGVSSWSGGSTGLLPSTATVGAVTVTGTLVVANGGTGTTNGSITGTGALTYTAGGSNTNVNLVPQGTGTVDVASKRITNVATPTGDTDAANKGYVDAVKTGLNVKDAARIATTAALTVAYVNGTAGVGATLTNAGTLAALTLDSIPAVVGDRVLVKDQAAALQNGIYTVTNIGTASVAWVLTRATDFDNNPTGEVGGGDFIFVQEGTSQQNNGYVVTTNGVITVGTTAIDFVQFSGAGQITAGDGLTKSGNTINAVGTANRITVAADSIDISTAYVGQTSITTLGTITTGTWTAGVVAGQYGGTGVANTGKTITLGGNLTTAGAFATTLTTTAATAVTLPTTGTLATLAGTETFTNKTLTAPVIATIVNTGTLTLPTSTDTLVGRATTDTLTNKTITGAIITTGSINNTPIGATTANTGAFTSLTSNAATTFTLVTDATVLGTAAVVLSGGISVAKTMYIGANITGAGPGTLAAPISVIDGFQMDGGTY
jgi:hypothetical protein